MKIKCIKTNVDDEDILNNDGEGFLKIGEEYHVAAIFIIRNYVYYDINFPISLILSFPCEMFEVVSSTVPTLWRIKIYDDGDIKIGPELFFDEYFFDNFSNGNDYETYEYQKIKHLLDV